MSISRIKAAGWADGEVLTATQQTSVDANIENAIDKRVDALDVESVSKQRVCSDPGTATDWTKASHDTTGIMQTNVNTLTRILFSLSLPKGATLTKVQVVLKGAGGHVGMPATKPDIIVYKISSINGTATSIGSATDASANTTAYQAVHTIDATMTETIDSELLRYAVVVETEDGANALAGASYYCAIAFCTMTKLSYFES